MYMQIQAKVCNSEDLEVGGPSVKPKRSLHNLLHRPWI